MYNSRTLKKNLAGLFMSLLIIYTSTLNTYAIDIQIGIQDNSPVDIILTGGDTDFDYEGFSEKLTAELVAAGVAEDRIQIQAAETSTLDITSQDPQLILTDWQRYGMPGVPWVYVPQLKSIRDTEYHCRRSGFYNALDIVEGSLEFSADIVGYAHRYNDFYGLTFCMNGTSDYYAVVFQDIEGSRCGMYRGMLYSGVSLMKIQNCNAVSCDRAPDHGTCTHSTVLGTYPSRWLPGVKWNLAVKYDGKGDFEVYLDDNLIITATDPNPYTSGSYGVVAVSHGSGDFSNIQLTRSSVKDLIEVIRAPEWRTNSARFIVDVCDQSREDFGTPEKVGELTQRMLANDAYYIGWGRDESKVSMQSFIQHNSNKGIFLDNTNPGIYRDTANYIEPIVNNRQALDGRVYLYKDKDYLFTQD